MGSSSGSSRRARIVKVVESPASFFAKLAGHRLERHWTQTYAIIAVASNSFIVLATFIIEPRFPPTDSLTYLILIPPLVGLLVIEYQLFLGKVHRKTVELYDSAPCRLKLTILRIHMKRKLLTVVTFGVNFVFSLFALAGVPVPFLTAGIPYYFTLNAVSLLGFRISNSKELDAVFEAIPQLRSLPEFYQTMTMRVMAERMGKRLKEQVPLAGEINPNHFLRMFYLDHVIPQQPSSQVLQITTDLKNALTKKGDLFQLLNQKYPQSVSISDAVSFDLPWEKRFNWGRAAVVILSILEALATLYTLQVFGMIDALLKLVRLA